MSNLVAAGMPQTSVGVPQNNPCYFDGTRYYLQYISATSSPDGTLSCKVGTSLDVLEITDTNGTGDISDIDNLGRNYGNVWGQVAGTHYLWSVLGRSGTGDGFVWGEWELTAEGLDVPTFDNAGVNNSDRRHSTLNINPVADVSELLGVSQIWNSSCSSRSNVPGLGSDQGENSFDGSLMDFPEHTHLFKLADGYLGFANDQGGPAEQSGDYGHATEWLKDSLGDAWGSESALTAADWREQDYAPNTSHAGQSDFVQRTDYGLWGAYCGCRDSGGSFTGGDFGAVHLLLRGGNKADSWEAVTTDLVDGGEAWAVALAPVGNDLVVFYLPDNGAGSRGSQIKYRHISATGTVGPEETFATVPDTFERLAVSKNNGNGKIVGMFNAYNGVNYDVYAEAIDSTGGRAGTRRSSIWAAAKGIRARRF